MKTIKIIKKPYIPESVNISFAETEKTKSIFKEVYEPVLSVLGMLGVIEYSQDSFQINEETGKAAITWENIKSDTREEEIGEADPTLKDLVNFFKEGNEVLIKDEEDEIYTIDKIYTKSGKAVLMWFGQVFGLYSLDKLIKKEDWEKEQLTNEEEQLPYVISSYVTSMSDNDNRISFTYDLSECGIYKGEDDNYSLREIIYLDYKDSHQFGREIVCLTEEQAKLIKNKVKITNF